MVTCAQQALDRADADLNSSYKALRAKLDDQGKNLLRDAQRAWIKYRDAECLRARDAVRGGTLASVIGVSCLSHMTGTRAKELKDDLKNY